MSDSNNNIWIGKVKNEKDRLDCFRLRYNVFTVEEKDYRYATKDRLFTDEIDGQKSILIACKFKNEIIGTLRIFKLTDVNTDTEQNYQIEKILEIENTVKNKRDFCVVDRGCVALKFRKEGLFRRMHDFAEKIAREMECKIILGAISFEKGDWLKSYLNNSYQIYSKPVNYNEWVGMNVYKTL